MPSASFKAPIQYSEESSVFTRSQTMVSLASYVDFGVVLTNLHFFSEKFPEAYIGGKAPATFGVRDPERNRCTPVYAYGWVVSRAELYEAINGEPSLRDIYLSQIYIGAGRLLYTRWREKGYDDNEYK